MLIHTGKRKIPSAHTHPYLWHCLSEPPLPGPPNVPSFNIYPSKTTLVWPHTTEEWELGLTCREMQANKKGEPGTFFYNKNCEKKLSARISVFRPSFSLKGIAYFHIRVLTASANNSIEEVPWMLLSGLPCNTNYVTVVETKCQYCGDDNLGAA